jgi:hypothetical protein
MAAWRRLKMLRLFALSLLLAIAVPVSRADDGADNGHGQSLSGCNLGSVDGCVRVDQATIDDDWARYRECHARAAELRLNDPNRGYCVGSRRSTGSRSIENTRG